MKRLITGTGGEQERMFYEWEEHAQNHVGLLDFPREYTELERTPFL